MPGSEKKTVTTTIRPQGSLRQRNWSREKAGWAPYLNGKVERFQDVSGLVGAGAVRAFARGDVRRMDGYREWYNCHRPHICYGPGRTPEEVWVGFDIPKPVAIRCRDPDKPVILVRRVNHRGDPGLPVIKILIQRGLIVG